MSIKKQLSMSEKSLLVLEDISKKKLTIGNLLCSIREGEEMTLVAFSEKLGVSRQYLCDLEHGRRVVSVKMAAEFAHKLDHSPIQFVRLALQEELERSGLHFDIQLKEAA